MQFSSTSTDLCRSLQDVWVCRAPTLAAQRITPTTSQCSGERFWKYLTSAVSASCPNWLVGACFCPLQAEPVRPGVCAPLRACVPKGIAHPVPSLGNSPAARQLRPGLPKAVGKRQQTWPWGAGLLVTRPYGEAGPTPNMPCCAAWSWSADPL